MDAVSTLRHTLRHKPVNPLDRTEADWSPWLVFADWLSERGDARGQGIALAHAIESGRGSVDEQRAWRAELRAFETARDPAQRWLDGIVVPPRAELSWVHGFVLGANLGSWGNEAVEVQFLDALAAHPTGVLFSRLGWRGDLRALSRCQGLDGIVQLDLSNAAFGTEGLAALAGNADLASVRHFRLDVPFSARTGDEELAPIVGSRLVEGLQSLHVQGMSLSIPTLRALLTTADLSRLETLALTADGIHEAGAVAIRDAALPALRSLDLGGNPLGPGGARALAGISGLNRLELERSGLLDDGALALADNRSATTLKHINLGANGIGPRGGRVLAEGIGLGVERLSLSRNAVGSEAAVALANGPLAPRLRRVDLRATNLRDRAALAIAASPGWSALEWIHLGYNDFGIEAKRALTTSASLAHATVHVTKPVPPAV